MIRIAPAAVWRLGALHASTRPTPLTPKNLYRSVFPVYRSPRPPISRMLICDCVNWIRRSAMSPDVRGKYPVSAPKLHFPDASQNPPISERDYKTAFVDIRLRLLNQHLYVTDSISAPIRADILN